MIVMGFGIVIGGWKIIKIVGGNIMKICLVNGVVVDLLFVLIIFVVLLLYFLLLIIYVVLLLILGVGVFNWVKGVKWSIV